ncbi:hypothetical protein P691DRAFT_789488 [Macrolepiota fuliginosa MF-IS2]|uniref:Uncharacterized protein n=1 Tax=Macrolepiota fuliginosa MF-IS2 TaxID=1400762 RepID=A0A9P5X2W2_9AGAR|nr:hypothetical protein P691DRAFT_789488 [Macrolepiota fuliginosa MF-IS2]
MHPSHSFLLFDSESSDGIGTEEDQLTRQSIFWRVGVFGFLEGAFLTLSSIVLARPIILNLPENISLSEAKGGFTMMTIIWHTLAIAAAKDILLFVFSAEWMAQYEHTGLLESRKTDRVSKLTTGVFGKTQHFLSRGATARYRLAVVLVGLFMSLGSVGPGAVIVNTIPVDFPIDINIANVTFPFNFNTTNNTWIIFTRANSILRLELFDNVTFGFESSDNLMIPWPSKQYNTNSGRVVYQSDVLSFNFNLWKYSIEDESIFWHVWDKIFIADAKSEAFVPMDGWPTTFFGSSWLFATYDTDSSPSNAPEIDLGGLPTTSCDEIEPKLNGSGFAVPRTITALVCDPQIEVYTAQVTLDMGTLHAVRSNNPPVGNIDSRELQQGATVSGLIPSLTYNFPDSILGISSSTFSSVTRLLFFCPEDTSKAFLDGYNGTRPDVDTLSVPNFNMFTTPAAGQANKMVLVTNNVSRSILGELGRLDSARAHATTSSLTLPSMGDIEKIYHPTHSRLWSPSG